MASQITAADVPMYVKISMGLMYKQRWRSLYIVHGIAEVFFGNLPDNGTLCCTPREYSGFNLLLENPCNDLDERATINAQSEANTDLPQKQSHGEHSSKIKTMASSEIQYPLTLK